MKAAPPKTFRPRKTPVQTRSMVTVDAIAEATIQVLLSDGLDRLTTNRVAERAGVSVGTLYQYFPNKHALLFALLEDALDKSAEALEVACEEARSKPLLEMISHVVHRFVDAKLLRRDISTALYRVSADLGGPALVKRMVQRSESTLAAMIRTAPDIALPPANFAVHMMYSAMAGAMRSALEESTPSLNVSRLKKHLVLLCQTYMAAETGRNSVPCGYHVS